MAKQTNKKQGKLNEVPNSTNPSNVSGEQTWYPSGDTTFVVTRSGIRVSDKEYTTNDSIDILMESEFWKRIVTRFPDGSKIEIVPFDKKKHRIW